MKTLIIFDSLYGNTEKIALAIAEAIPDTAKALKVSEANPSELESLDLLIVGSPVQAGRPTKDVQEFISKIPDNDLKNVRVAAFDTRVKNVIARLFGYAAGRVADGLKEKGGRLAAPPEGFIVKGVKGPLKEGELERAAEWAKGIIKNKITS